MIRRVDDVDTIYSTRSTQDAARLLRKYDVGYVYVGQLERLYYPETGIRKFGDGMAGVLERVYSDEQSVILPGGALGLGDAPRSFQARLGPAGQGAYCRKAAVRVVVGVAGIEPAASCSQSRRAPSAPHPVGLQVQIIG